MVSQSRKREIDRAAERVVELLGEIERLTEQKDTLRARLLHLLDATGGELVEGDGWKVKVRAPEPRVTVDRNMLLLKGVDRRIVEECSKTGKRSRFAVVIRS